MHTLPMPLDAMSAGPDGLDEFRVSAARDLATLLQRLADGNVQINLISSGGSVLSAVLWTIDAERRQISFSAEADDPGLQTLLESDDAVAVGYLDAVKIQFDLDDPVLVRGPRASVLRCAYPRELFRFQRRNAYRVRPLLRSAPTARLRHTEIAEMQLQLRVLDVSIGGCALFLPSDIPALRPGSALNEVLVELDADTRFQAQLRLQHITSLNAEQAGVRLGCEFINIGGDALRALQRFIDQTQKRGKLLALR